MLKKVAVTFDLDYTNYLNDSTFVDEFEEAWPFFLSFCNTIKDLKTTWFIRIDKQIKSLHGSEDYIFLKHADKIEWLRNNGHEIGWHFHSYVISEGKWVQNANEELVVQEMKQVFPIVQKHKLEISRMGWTYHTNKTMKTLEQLGIKFDFSAFPRPNYKWDKIVRDWHITPCHTYKPSLEDYRIPGNPSLDLYQVPITSLALPSKTDTDIDVLRYLNPAYKEDYFKIGLSNTDDFILNTLSHPYEFLPSGTKHEMLSFSPNIFLSNLQTLKNIGYTFVGVSEYIKIQLT